MGGPIRSKARRFRWFAVVAAVASVLLAAGGSEAAMSGHHSFLGGPWELVFKMGLEGAGYRFAIEVPDETKPHDFNSELPIIGTDVKIKLDKYVPDLQWDESAVDDPNGGALVKLDLAGPNLNQRIWLDSADPAKQSISAKIGAMSIRKLYNPKTAAGLIKELVDSGSVGVVMVRTSSDAEPLEFVVKKGTKIDLPGGKSRVEVLEYYSHYSIDSKTNKVTNVSQVPVNPAVKVRITDGRKKYEKWLWSKFPNAPHGRDDQGLDVRFTDFDLGRGGRGRYILAVTGQGQMWLLTKDEKGKVTVEAAKLNKAYNFAVDGYTFKVVEFHDSAVINRSWANRSNKLLHPALVTTVTADGATQQMILPLGQPSHIKTKAGTVVLLYKRSGGDEKPS